MRKMEAEIGYSSTSHAWYPTQCPAAGDVETVENKKPEITSSSVKCPRDNGKIFMGSDGTWFYQQCCADADGAVLLNYAKVSSHDECAEACVKDKACKSFMFVPDMVPTEGTANCRLYKDGQFSTTKVDGAHYAFVVDPPTTEPILSEAKRCATTCPEADGQLYATPSGENYLMTCKARHGTTYLKIDNRPSFEACMSSCAAMPACLSADYEPRTKKCFYSTNTARPSISADAFVSAHSLGCAGACQGCKKNCDQLNGEALPVEKPECNKNNGDLVIAGGEGFRLYCGHCYRSHNSWTLEKATGIASCAKARGEDSYCHGANWIGGKLCPDGKCNALASQSRSIPEPY
ncbi:uncharacterized protein F5Z01DRAFT_675095 [Emericellopsis atlantica]|uniref:Apple domain-containing protein n=1 Tax=Emericellopsis atlantica TaxID=2614577 RepID=A0A9P7ZJC1_9HYPO|nr:uncharacterized protein F5Z01DRAFT_675095 [Emericellopsis atlantica]KAG9253174.1 hypothetical protein F5Z01DRAFT_675095 [Emericellopsis atlantica]